MLRVVVFLVLFLFAPPALACGGFLAPRLPPGQTSTPDLRSDGSKVALLRSGIHTVTSLSMRYRGPPDDFALVVPVPVVLQKQNVRTLHPGTFELLDALTRPVLVEQWEEDPCLREYQAEWSDDAKEGGTGARAKGEEGSAGGVAPAPVKVEAAFSVDEYDIVILGASDSLALERWLADAGYALPTGIEPFLRPYVAAGSKFFVAKVDASKIELSWGRAVLSPLRFEYDSETFSLPIRLGLANVDGDQDLTVYVLGRGTRYEAANYENALIPTNLRLVDGAEGRFSAFYEKLFVDTLAKHPKSFVTEAAVPVESCHDCAGMISDLGGDAGPSSSPFVLSRLHTRYGAAFAADLVLRTAAPVEGGTESYGAGDLPAALGRPAAANDFRGRYFVRHGWSDTIDCSSPSYGTWTGTNTGSTSRPPPPSSTPLEQWTVHGAEAHAPARTRIYDRLAHVVHLYDAIVVLPLGLVLVIALGVIAWRARRLALAWWRPALAMLVVGMAPALTLLSRPTWHTVQSTPLVVYQALLYLVAAAVLVGTATARAAGRRPPDGFDAVALAPVFFALVAGALSLDRVEGISFDARSGVPLRVFAEAEGEALDGVALGALASLLLLAVVAASRVLAPATSDPPRSEVVRLGAGRWVIAVAVGVATNALVFRGADDEAWSRWLLFPTFLVGLALTWRSEKQARRASDAWMLSAAWLLATLLVGFACIASTRSLGLEATSGESVDPSQRGRILDAMNAATRTLAWRVPLAALGSIVPPAWLALRNAAAVPRARTFAPIGVVVVACAVGFWATRSTIARLYASQQQAPDERAHVEGVEPAPVALDDGLRLDYALDGPSLLATSAGVLLGSPNAATAPRPFDDATWTRMASDTLREPADPLLVVDKNLTVGRIDAALEPVLKRRHNAFRWVLGQRRPATDGMYGLVAAGPDERGAVALEWRRKIRVEPARANDPEASIVPEAVAMRSVSGAIETIALSGVHGRYRKFTSSTVHPIARPSSDPAEMPSLVPNNMRVVEVVLCLGPETDVATLTAMMLAAMPLPPREGWPRQPTERWLRDHPVLRFVVTTDSAPFAP